MEKEAKKEAFRKYLESCGLLDTLTKALVSLYEESDRPPSATEFILERLGGAKMVDYEKLRAEKSDLLIKYEGLLKAYVGTCKELQELKIRQELLLTERERHTWRGDSQEP